MDYEHTAELAQRYLEDRPVVVLGCGASIPYGLPSMAELSKALIDKINLDDGVWLEFKKDLGETQDLEISLHNVNLSDPIVERVVVETWKITAEKDIAVHDGLLQGSMKLALTRLFQHLLRTANPQLSVVTTNYDRLAEYAANSANAEVYTGFTKGWLA